jgi:hypothetical protein
MGAKEDGTPRAVLHCDSDAEDSIAQILQRPLLGDDLGDPRLDHRAPRKVRQVLKCAP